MGNWEVLTPVNRRMHLLGVDRISTPLLIEFVSSLVSVMYIYVYLLSLFLLQQDDIRL